MSSLVRVRIGLRQLGAVLAVAAVLAGCGSSAGGSGSNHAPTFGVVLPFSGSVAQEGLLSYPPCQAATSLINAAGGVLGDRITCQQIDDVGDAADAVPNVSKALATNSSLAGFLGVDSNVAATVIPILNNAKLPTISNDGLSAFDVNHYQYFWRDVSPDPLAGAAMGLSAVQSGHKRVALITQNDVGDTGNLPGALKALAFEHAQVTNNLTIPGDGPSYESLVTRVAAAHPDVLIISTDEQTLGTLLAEYKTLGGGTVPPTITSTDILDAKSFSVIKASTNLQYLLNKVSFVGGYVDQNTPQFVAYRKAMDAATHGKEPTEAINNGIVASIFDAAQVLALAMDRAHSTVGSRYNKDIPMVTTARAGAIVVHTYAQGAAELRSGHQIQYVGVTGPIVFDQYHNSPGQFAAFAFTSTDGTRTLSVLPHATLASLAR